MASFEGCRRKGGLEPSLFLHWNDQLRDKEVKSRVADCPADYLFTARVLHNYDVRYYRCRQTGFIQTEEPYWLDEAYSDAITALDIGMLSRNLKARRMTATFIDGNFPKAGSFVDYGGGYGIFTRLMRDWGFDFRLYDPICENLFAKQFAITLPVEQATPFDLVTAWELFEHVSNPLGEIEKMFSLSDTILFSTELVPSKEIRSVDDWWYFIPETGQHVSLYTRKSLEQIAMSFGARLHTNGFSIHLMTKQHDIRNPFPNRGLRLAREAIYQLKRRVGHHEGLTKSDLAQIRGCLSDAKNSGPME